MQSCGKCKNVCKFTNMGESQKVLNPIVGVWEVEAKDAPFQWHVMTFTPYGTVIQSNPHEGNKQESDSNGHGIWEVYRKSAKKHLIIGKFIEFKADRVTGSYIGKGVIEFSINVTINEFSGSAYAYFYNSKNELMKGPLISPMHGNRVLLDRTIVKYIQ